MSKEPAQVRGAWKPLSRPSSQGDRLPALGGNTALGLAVLTTLAASTTNHLTDAHHPLDQALTFGFHTGFLGAAGFVALAALAAATLGTRRHRKQTPTSHIEGDAREHQP